MCNPNTLSNFHVRQLHEFSVFTCPKPKRQHNPENASRSKVHAQHHFLHTIMVYVVASLSSPLSISHHLIIGTFSASTHLRPQLDNLCCVCHAQTMRGPCTKRTHKHTPCKWSCDDRLGGVSCVGGYCDDDGSGTNERFLIHLQTLGREARMSPLFGASPASSHCGVRFAPITLAGTFMRVAGFYASCWLLFFAPITLAVTVYMEL